MSKGIVPKHILGEIGKATRNEIIITFNINIKKGWIGWNSWGDTRENQATASFLGDTLFYNLGLKLDE